MAAFFPCSRATIGFSLAPNLLFFTTLPKDAHKGHTSLCPLKKHLAGGRNLGLDPGSQATAPPPHSPERGKGTSEKSLSLNRLSFSVGGRPLIATQFFLSPLGVCRVLRQGMHSSKHSKKRYFHVAVLKEIDCAGRPVVNKGHRSGEMNEFVSESLLVFRHFFNFSTCEMALKGAQLEMHALYFLIRVWPSPPTPAFCFKLSPKQNAKPPVFSGFSIWQNEFVHC